MKINIASFGGRSHMLDLARELEKYGHCVSFYSYLPNSRTKKFGLKNESNQSLFKWAFPFVLFFRFFGHNIWVYHLYQRIFDYVTAWLMKPCDVFIGQSPMHVYSLSYAKKKFNAIAILERGTSHVIEQTKALIDNPAFRGSSPMPKLLVNRDLKGYKEADYIVVGSEHVQKSFIKHNFLKDRIFVNNYGVDIKQFEPTKLQNSKQYDILIVGSWCYRKGCDLLIPIVEKLKLKLLHVGSIGDVKFPESGNFKHIDSVQEKELKQFYEIAKIFVLPSREEGLAMVQVQALACGLPIVCSKKSGGRDLMKHISDTNYIIEMESLTTDELEKCIKYSLNYSKNLYGYRNYFKGNIEDLSWVGYGKRYNNFLKEELLKINS